MDSNNNHEWNSEVDPFKVMWSSEIKMKGIERQVRYTLLW